MPKHPTPTLQSWGIIPTPPHRHPRQAGAEMRAEGTFSEAARHLETSAASCETDWLLAFAANNKKQPGVAAAGRRASAAFQARRESPARLTHARRSQPPNRTTTPAVPRARIAPPPPRRVPPGSGAPGWGRLRPLRSGGGGGSREPDAVERRRRWLRLEAATARAPGPRRTALTSGPS